MRGIFKKLETQRGASILLALMLFFVCFMVSSVIISSATASVDKMREREENQEEYFAISSAADVLQEVMASLEFTGWETNTVYECYGVWAPLDPEKHTDQAEKCVKMDYKIVGATARMREDIERMLYKAFSSHTKFVSPVAVADVIHETFVISGTNMPDVNVKVSLNTKTYHITCALTLADATAGTRNGMTVQFQGAVTAPSKEEAAKVIQENADVDHEVETTIEHDDGTISKKMLPAEYDITVYTLNTKVVYDAGTMTKGVETLG